MKGSHQLERELDSVRSLANGSRIRRLVHTPVKYLYSVVYRTFLYPLTNQRGQLVRANTFFQQEMNILLPAGMDLYLLGAKSHDSELRLAKYLCRAISPGDVLVDVGAHFGYYSLLASRLVGQEGRVISVEASREIFDILEQNTQSCSNIQIHNVACSDVEEEIDYFEFPVLYSEYNTMFPGQFEKSGWYDKYPPRTRSIQGVPLDQLLKEYRSDVDLIKIDVEGAEYKVLSGLKETLKEHDQLTVSMEYLREERGNDAHIESVQMLQELGYQSHYINREGNLQDIEPSNISSYLLHQQLSSDNFIFKRG